MSVSIKISEENYEHLCSISGELQKNLHRRVSINEALGYIFKKGKLSDLAGSLGMSDTEVKETTGSLRRGWNKWSTRSA